MVFLPSIITSRLSANTRLVRCSVLKAYAKASPALYSPLPILVLCTNLDVAKAVVSKSAPLTIVSVTLRKGLPINFKYVALTVLLYTTSNPLANFIASSIPRAVARFSITAAYFSVNPDKSRTSPVRVTSLPYIFCPVERAFSASKENVS